MLSFSPIEYFSVVLKFGQEFSLIKKIPSDLVQIIGHNLENFI